MRRNRRCVGSRHRSGARRLPGREGRLGLARLRRSERRSERVRPPDGVRHRPHTEPPRRVRPRNPSLRRCATRAPPSARDRRGASGTDIVVRGSGLHSARCVAALRLDIASAPSRMTRVSDRRRARARGVRVGLADAPRRSCSCTAAASRRRSGQSSRRRLHATIAWSRSTPAAAARATADPQLRYGAATIAEDLDRGSRRARARAFRARRAFVRRRHGMPLRRRAPGRRHGRRAARRRPGRPRPPCLARRPAALLRDARATPPRRFASCCRAAFPTGISTRAFDTCPDGTLTWRSDMIGRVEWSRNGGEPLIPGSLAVCRSASRADTRPARRGVDALPARERCPDE